MREELLKILNKIRPDIDFEKENQLLSGEILDSFDVMLILADLSDVFNIEIDPDNVNEMYFDDITGIEKLFCDTLEDMKNI